MKMQSMFKALAFCGCLLMLMGCPYSSDVPLTAGGVKVPANLIGTWEDSGATDKDKFEVKKTGETTVDIVKTAAYDGAQTTYKGFFTEIGGTLFLNLKENTEYASFYFYRVNPEGANKLTLQEVTSYIDEKFTDSAAMKAFFEKNMNHSFFYSNEETTYYKVN